MDIKVFVTACVTALGVIVALVIGVKSLRQTENIQSKQYRHGLLNEIIEWATDIAKCESESEITTLPIELPNYSKYQREQHIAHVNLVGQVELKFRYQTIDVRNDYIETIAKEFGEDLHSAVEKTAGLLDENIVILCKFLRKEITEEARDKKYRENWQSLVESSIDVTEKAAKIKTKCIK